MPRTKKQRLKRRKDGRYACRYKSQWFYGSTSDEALAAREAYKQTEGRRVTDAGKMNIIDYCDKWLSTYRAHVKKHTYNSYASALESFFAPINNYAVESIQTAEIAACLKGIDKYSPYQINRILCLSRAIFDTAVEEGILQHNPARSKTLHIPKGKAGKGHRAITDEERALIHKVKHPLQVFYLLMLYAGLRPGEALGLTLPDDIDTDKGILYVRRAIDLLTDRQKPTISEGKNAFAVRTVPLIPFLQSALKGITGPVVQSKDGGYLARAEYLSLTRSYQIALTMELNHVKKIPRRKPDGWKQVTFTAYDMRHSFCTTSRDAGVDMKVLMTWMGHSDYSMIMKIYDHVTDARLTASAENLKNHLQNMEKYVSGPDS